MKLLLSEQETEFPHLFQNLLKVRTHFRVLLYRTGGRAFLSVDSSLCLSLSVSVDLSISGGPRRSEPA